MPRTTLWLQKIRRCMSSYLIEQLPNSAIVLPPLAACSMWCGLGLAHLIPNPAS